MAAPAPAFAPSERTTGGSIVKVIVLGLVGLFIVVPILAIFALTMLGRTVEEEFTPVPIESGAAAPAAEAVDAPVLAFEDAAAPANAQLHVGSTGLYTMSVHPSWTGPVVEANPVTGLESTHWTLNEYTSAVFFGNVNVAYSPQPAGATLDSVTQAEINVTQSQLNVVNIDQRDRQVNGVTFRELTMDATIEGIDLTFFSVFRLDGDVVHMATLTTTSEVAAEARAEIEPYLLTLDVEDVSD